MLGELAKRLVNAGVLFLAAVTFFLVPFGVGTRARTPAQHLMAIFGTAPAREAADACADAGRRIAASFLALRAEAEPAAEPELMPAD